VGRRSKDGTGRRNVAADPCDAVRVDSEGVTRKPVNFCKASLLEARADGDLAARVGTVVVVAVATHTARAEGGMRVAEADPEGGCRVPGANQGPRNRQERAGSFRVEPAKALVSQCCLVPMSGPMFNEVQDGNPLLQLPVKPAESPQPIRGGNARNQQS
jgi:hypothetical protein